MTTTHIDPAALEAADLAKRRGVAADASGLERLADEVVAGAAGGGPKEAFARLVAAHLRRMAIRARNGGW